MVKAKWAKHCKNLRTQKGEQEFHTAAGMYKATGKAIIELSLSDLNKCKVITWACYLDSTDELRYDVIIGRDLMNEIGLSLDFKNQEIVWEDLRLSMRKQSKQDRSTNIIFPQSMEPNVTQEMTERATKY